MKDNIPDVSVAESAAEKARAMAVQAVRDAQDGSRSPLHGESVRAFNARMAMGSKADAGADVDGASGDDPVTPNGDPRFPQKRGTDPEPGHRRRKFFTMKF